MRGRVIGAAAVNNHFIYANEDKTDLPWMHAMGDLPWFKYLSTNSNVIVGSKTHLTLPPLPNRIVIPVGSQHEVKTPALTFDHGDPYKNYVIAGGAAIWEWFWPFYDDFYLTIVDNDSVDGHEFTFIKEKFVKEEWIRIIVKNNYSVWKHIDCQNRDLKNK